MDVDVEHPDCPSYHCFALDDLRHNHIRGCASIERIFLQKDCVKRAFRKHQNHWVDNAWEENPIYKVLKS